MFFFKIKSNNLRKITVSFIIFIGFIIRFYAATTVPLNFDEEDFFQVAKVISFNFKKLNLPLVDKKYPSPILIKYIIKLGLLIFGNNTLGGRVPFVIIGTLTLFFVYFMVKRILGKDIALISLLLLTFSQFHIGHTRIANDDCLIVFLSAFNLYFFYNALKQNHRKKMILCGIFIGLSFFAKENLSFFLGIFFLYILLTPKYRFWFKEKELYLGFLVAISLMGFLIFLNYINSTPRFAYIRNESKIGISINAIGLYLGELIIMLFKKHPSLDVLLDTLDYEYPFEFWLIGIICLTAIFYSLKYKNYEFIRLMLITFFFNFILFSCVKNVGDTPGKQFYISLGSIDWGSISFLPAIILGGNMLYNLVKKHRVYLPFLFIFFVILIWNAWRFVNFPLNCFVPIRGYAEEEWFKFVENYYISGERNKAKDLLERIYRIAQEDSIYKKKSALKLAEILIQENQYNESKKYLYYLINKGAYNNEVKNLIEIINSNLNVKTH